MPRKNQGVHGRPENAGIKNMPEGFGDKNKDDDNTLAGLMPIYNNGMKNRQDYKGVWTEEELTNEIQAYFDYCSSASVKVAKVGISLWLGIRKETMYEWVRNPAKYEFKSHLMRQAFDLVELSYIGRSEKYPTANIFLLKSSHGHAETTKVEINGSQNTSVEEIDEVIGKLGLDKPKSE